jgi:hypothetical protein
MRSVAAEILVPAMRQAPQAVYAAKGRIVEANKTVRPPFDVRSLD